MIAAESISDPVTGKRRIIELWLALGRKWGEIFKVLFCKYCCILCHVFCRTEDQSDEIFIGIK